jgi:hypothetical protein
MLFEIVVEWDMIAPMDIACKIFSVLWWLINVRVVVVAHHLTVATTTVPTMKE